VRERMRSGPMVLAASLRRRAGTHGGTYRADCVFDGSKEGS